MSLSVVLAHDPHELENLYRFRYQVYVREQGLSPRDADHEHQLLRDSLDLYSVSYALIDRDEVVGSLRMTYLAELPDISAVAEKFAMQNALVQFGRSAICTTSRFIIASRFTGTKGMLRLMERAYRDGRDRGVRLVYGDCSPALLPFYRHLGYRPYGNGFHDPDYGEKVLLMMLCDDHSWFQQVRSPFARVPSIHSPDAESRAWFESQCSSFSPS